MSEMDISSARSETAAEPAPCPRSGIANRRNAVPPLVVVGCDFRVASSLWRSQLLLTPEERGRLAEELRQACQSAGLMVLETCNRVEWVATAADPVWTGEVMRAQMAARWSNAAEVLQLDPRRMPSPYVYTGRPAVAHLLRVAVGLESFVVGEREIAGQLNKALVAARGAGQTSKLHNALQTALGRTVKKVQRRTAWRHTTRGVHSLALEVLQEHLRQTGAASRQGQRPRVAVIGMGEIGRKAAGIIEAHGDCEVIRVNRSIPAARQGEWLPLDQLAGLLPSLDALVVATGARAPVLHLRELTSKSPKNAPPLLVVDLGSPMQVSGAELPWIRYAGLDQLVARPNVGPSDEEVAAAVEVVEEGVREFQLECKKRDLAPLLRAAHDLYDATAYLKLPELLEHELPGEANAELRKRVQQATRDLLRDMARDMVREIEHVADVRTTRSRVAVDGDVGV